MYIHYMYVDLTWANSRNHTCLLRLKYFSPGWLGVLWLMVSFATLGFSFRVALDVCDIAGSSPNSGGEWMSRPYSRQVT